MLAALHVEGCGWRIADRMLEGFQLMGQSDEEKDSMDSMDSTDSVRANKLELDIQRELVTFLLTRGWHVERMSADAFQNGIPDLFCYQKKWGMRWVEVKRPVNYSFTLRQRQKWPAWEKAGIGIWILTAATQEQYDLLFQPPNWRDFWRPSFQIPGKSDVDEMIDTLAREYQQSQATDADVRGLPLD